MPIPKKLTVRKNSPNMACNDADQVNVKNVRITFVIYSLSSGGSERVLCTMANYWAERGYRICILTLDDGREPPFYDLHPAVTHQPLSLAGDSVRLAAKVVNNAQRIWLLRDAIKKTSPHAVISFMART